MHHDLPDRSTRFPYFWVILFHFPIGKSVNTCQGIQALPEPFAHVIVLALGPKAAVSAYPVDGQALDENGVDERGAVLAQCPLRSVQAQDGSPLSLGDGLRHHSAVDGFLGWVNRPRAALGGLEIVLEPAAALILRLVNEAPGVQRSERIPPRGAQCHDFTSDFVWVVDLDCGGAGSARQVGRAPVMNGRSRNPDRAPQVVRLAAAPHFRTPYLHDASLPWLLSQGPGAAEHVEPRNVPSVLMVHVVLGINGTIGTANVLGGTRPHPTVRHTVWVSADCAAYETNAANAAMLTKNNAHARIFIGSPSR